MADDIALIVPYTNFANFRSIRENLYRFRQAQAYKAIVVELSLTGRFEAATESSDIRLHSTVRSIMPQRSRLVNLAIRQLSPDIKKIAWLDGDVLFDDAQWLDKLSDLLSDHAVAQPFDVMRTLNGNGDIGDLGAAWVNTLSGPTKYKQVWGANLDTLPKLPDESRYIGLLDRVLVDEDATMLSYWSGNGTPDALKQSSIAAAGYCQRWAGPTVQRQIGCLAAAATTMFSGVSNSTANAADQAYLQTSNYDPHTSLVIDQKTGVYNWANERQRSIVYFLDVLYTRDRDGHLPAIVDPPVRGPVDSDAPATTPIISPLVLLPPSVTKRRDPAKPTVVILTPGLGLGGAEQWVRMLVTYSKSFNWVVGVLSRANWHPVITSSVVRNAEVHSVLTDTPGVTSHIGVQQMIAAITSDADAVVYWGAMNAESIPTKAPVIFVGHGTCQWTTTATTIASETGVKLFAAVSENAASYMRDVAPDVRVIWNGVDTKRLQPAEDRDAVRAGWLYDGQGYAKYIGYMGRLGDEKNVDSLIHAMTLLPFTYYLVLIGCTGGQRDRILKLARTLLHGRLVEVPAVDDIGPLLTSLDCLVQVSPREGNSLTIAEAMYCRVPIVSTRTGALPEMEAIAGFPLVHSVPDTPLASEVAAAIRHVCTVPQVEQVEASYKFASQYLTAPVMCRLWQQYLQEVINASHKAASTVS